MVLDLPDVVEAELVGEADLLERLPVRVGLRGEAVEWLRPADLVDKAELDLVPGWVKSRLILASQPPLCA